MGGEIDVLVAVVTTLLTCLIGLLAYIGRCLIKKVDRLESTLGQSYMSFNDKLNDLKHRQSLQTVVMSAAFPMFAEMWDKAVKAGNPLPTIRGLEEELGIER